jgi:hypothetical protein
MGPASFSIAEWRKFAGLPFRWALLTAIIFLLAVTIFLLGLILRFDSRVQRLSGRMTRLSTTSAQALAQLVSKGEGSC